MQYIPNGGTEPEITSDTFKCTPVIEAIREKVGQGAFEFSQHAIDQTILRRITLQEVRVAIASAEVIEDYPEDKYGPSCLLLGFTQVGRPLHLQCSYPSRPLIKIVTIYEPDPNQWIGYRQRRK